MTQGKMALSAVGIVSATVVVVLTILSLGNGLPDYPQYEKYPYPDMVSRMVQKTAQDTVFMWDDLAAKTDMLSSTAYANHDTVKANYWHNYYLQCRDSAEFYNSNIDEQRVMDELNKHIRK